VPESGCQLASKIFKSTSLINPPSSQFKLPFSPLGHSSGEGVNVKEVAGLKVGLCQLHMQLGSEGQYWLWHLLSPQAALYPQTKPPEQSALVLQGR